MTQSTTKLLIAVGLGLGILLLLPILAQFSEQQPPPAPARQEAPARLAPPPPMPVAPPQPRSSGVIEQAFRNHSSGLPVAETGTVSRTLSDDNEGSRHQRFIVQLASGHTILIAHNIDIAPRINSLRTGDAVAFSGVYEWKPEGGVVHWTHRDPSGRHQAGYIQHNGMTYQ